LRGENAVLKKGPSLPNNSGARKREKQQKGKGEREEGQAPVQTKRL